jgi:predicted PurR-regulated permease PerM
MSPKQTDTWFLVAAGAIAAYLCYRIFEPFLTPVFIAVVLTVVFYPLHSRIESRLRRPNFAAAVSMLIVIFLAVVPSLFLGIVVSRELRAIVQSLSVKSATEGGLAPYLMHMLEAPLRVVGRYVDVSSVDIHSTVIGWVDQASRYLLQLGAKVAGNMVEFVLGTVVVFFTLFFLFRDGREICRQLTAALPLGEERSARLMRRIYESIVASAHGGVAVALAQGAMNALGFWFVGIPAPVLWGIAAAIASLLPVVGTGLVWLPASVALLGTGHPIKALILFAWGSAVVAQIDAVVRPYVMSRRTNLPNLILFFSLLGGVKAFGMVGVFVGPIAIAVASAVLDFLQQQTGPGPRETNSATAPPAASAASLNPPVSTSADPTN